MSTRCQIAFIVDDGWLRRERWVYRHFDGYPGDGKTSGVLADLASFLLWNASRMRDVEYCAANFVFWSKWQACASLRDPVRPGDWSRVPQQLLGFGVCVPGEFHCDVGFFYEVVTDDGGTTVVAYAVEQTSWGVPVTRACLRRLAEVRYPP